MCTDCGTKDNLVMSGVDAFMLEVIDLVEKICYNCANRRKASLA